MTGTTMKRTVSWAAAIALGAGLFAGAADHPAAAREKKEDKAPAQKFSPGVIKAFGPGKPGEKAAIQNEIEAKNWPAATARLVEADAVPNRTGDDNYNIGIFKVQIAQGSGNNALLKEGIAQVEASGKATPELHNQFVRVQAGLAIQANDYATAQKFYEEMAAANPNDPSTLSDLAKIYLRAKQTQKADEALAKAIAASVAKSGKADEELYALRLQLAFDSKMLPEVLPRALTLVRAYPSAKNWDAAIYALRANQKMDEQLDIDTYRLQRATGSMTGEGQWLDYAQTAQMRGLPAESRAVLAEGVAKKIVDPKKPNYLELARGAGAAKIAADRASLPASEKQARAAANGKIANGTADGYFGQGEFAKAAELYRVALAKGGVDVARVNTRLGIALGQTGDKAGAEAAFKAVSGEPRATLAQYWLIWLAQKA